MSTVTTTVTVSDENETTTTTTTTTTTCTADGSLPGHSQTQSVARMPTVKQDDDDEVEADFGTSSKRFTRHPTPTGATSMLVVDREVDPEGLLATAALASVVVVDFDSGIDSTEVFVSKIEAAYAANGGTQLATVGFANHGGRAWQLATDCICQPTRDDEEYVIAAAPVLSALAKCTAEGGRIDLFGCRLLTLDELLPDKLEKMFKGIHFTASDDDTGNPRAGGDWIMESDGLDVSTDYFDPVKLKAYSDTMFGFFDWMDAIPFVGTLVRSVRVVAAVVRGDTEAIKDELVKMAANLAGDIVTIGTAGSGTGLMLSAKFGAKFGLKAGMQAVKRKGIKLLSAQGAKTFLSGGVKHAGPAFLEAAKTHMTKAMRWSTMKRHGIDTLMNTNVNALKACYIELLKPYAPFPTDLSGIIRMLHDATGISTHDLTNMAPTEFLTLFTAIGSMAVSDMTEFQMDMAKPRPGNHHDFIAVGITTNGQACYRRGMSGSWESLDKILQHVAISSCGGHIIGCPHTIDRTEVAWNTPKYIYYRAGVHSYWQQIRIHAYGNWLRYVSIDHASISDNGEILACDSESGRILYMKDTNSTAESMGQLPGGVQPVQVSISSCGKHYAGTDGNCYIYRGGRSHWTDPDYDYRRPAGNWKLDSGRAKQISISGYDAKHVSVVNSPGNVFYRHSAGLGDPWTLLDGILEVVSVSSCGGLTHHLPACCPEPTPHFLGCTSAHHVFYKEGLSGIWHVMPRHQAMKVVAIGRVTPTPHHEQLAWIARTAA